MEKKGRSPSPERGNRSGHAATSLLASDEIIGMEMPRHVGKESGVKTTPSSCEPGACIVPTPLQLPRLSEETGPDRAS